MRDGSSRSAATAGAGILLSRITGFLRDLAIAYFFGTSLVADAYTAALKIPNILRNLLGEGTLSAAFIPVYSAMLEEEARDPGSAGGAPPPGGAPSRAPPSGAGPAGPGSGEAARSPEAGAPAGAPGIRPSARLAGGVLGVLLVVGGAMSAVGVLAAPWLTRILAPGWDAEATRLTTALVRILFPMSGIMILAAWALGVLNSHRRFFLPFAAPVLWNLSQVLGLLLAVRLGWTPLVFVLAWSTLVGSVLQLGVQLPKVRALGGRVRPRMDWGWEPVRRVTRNMVPVASSQGIFQISSFIDLQLASLLPHGAVAGLYFAQRIVYLPLSLFGVSVAAATLPDMSRERALEALRPRLTSGFFRILYFVLPSAVAFVIHGDLMIRLVYQRAQFGAKSTFLVTEILVAYSVGLVGSSMVKLFASGFHALQDTKTPMRIAMVAVAVSTLLGAGAMFLLEASGYGALAAAGLALGAAAGGWLNFALLWHGLRKRLGPIFDRGAVLAVLRLCAAAAVAIPASLFARHALEERLAASGIEGAIVLLGTLLAGGVAYLAIARTPSRYATVHDRSDTPAA